MSNEIKINPEYSNYMPVWKLALYCILTLGLYDYYWFYRNWKFIKIFKQKKLNPLIRSVTSWAPILMIIWPFILFKELYSIIKNYSKTKCILIALTLTFLFAGINSFRYEKGNYKWIAFFTFIPLFIVQHDINIYYKKGLSRGE